MLGLNQETGIYNDHPPGRWPLHIGRPISTGHFTFYRDDCPTPYAKPIAKDPAGFGRAMDEGRDVCESCVAWLREHELLPAA